MPAKVTALVYENYVCRKPVNEVKALEDVLAAIIRNLLCPKAEGKVIPSGGPWGRSRGIY
jgi:hypothetical protein